jgi:D-hydroxyproline dehydrogenase subunit alpha
MSETFETVVVGMGPAGMAAAIELCRYGVQIAVIDENALPGGQVYRRMPIEFAANDESLLGANYKKGKQLIAEFNEAGKQCTLFNDSYIWGCFDNHVLALRHNDNITLLKYKKLLLSEGASERPAVFPGWTLPGVMTLGGLQKLITHERILPGRRFLLAGASPLLLSVAAELLRAGGELSAVCTAIPIINHLKLLPHLFLQGDLLSEIVRNSFQIITNRTRLFSQYTIVSCSGKNRVEFVNIGKLNSEGTIIAGSEKTLEIDILGVSNGFLPLSRIARLVGCQHVFDLDNRYWRVTTAPLFRSSLQDVFITGDSHDIGGRDLAILKGQLAGLQIAKELGHLPPDHFDKLASENFKKRKKLHAYVSRLKKVFSQNIESLDQIDMDTVVCRCEQITLRELLAGIKLGYRNINEIKRIRVGMGLCQGRICESIITQIMLKSGIPIEEISYFNVRPPISPIPISLFEGYFKKSTMRA